MELQDLVGRQDAAVETAKRLISVENTGYFKIRSIPEDIPTETYEARLYLAKTATNKEAMLRPAVEGLLQFAKVSLPRTRAMNPDGTGAGMPTREAEDKAKLGLGALKQLEALYRASGDKAGLAWASDADRDFKAALEPSK
jgi:hypothetical protein